MEILVITGTTVLSATAYIVSTPGGQSLAYSQFLTTGDVIAGVLLLALLVMSGRSWIVDTIRRK
jgi:hypothetical protein